MIQRKLFTVHNHFYVSLDYLAEYGEPKTVEEIDQHRIISFGEPVPPASGRHQLLSNASAAPTPRRAAPAMKVNAIYGMMQACRAGIGIAMLPDYVTESEDHPQARPGRHRTAAPTRPISSIPLRLKNSKRVGVFRDFLVGKARRVAVLATVHCAFSHLKP